jgi:hypothetical protein
MARRRVTQEELDIIIKQHHLWLESNHVQGIKADLSNTDCSGLNFRIRENPSLTNLLGRPNLSEADFTNVDLRGSDLSAVRLSWANLTRADLTGTDLRGVDLSLFWWQPKFMYGTSITFTGATMPDGHQYGEYLGEWISESCNIM